MILNSFKVISLSFRTSIVVHVNFFIKDTDMCYPKCKRNVWVDRLYVCDWTPRLDI